MEAPKRADREIVSTQSTQDRLVFLFKNWDRAYLPVGSNKRSGRLRKTLTLVGNAAMEKKAEERKAPLVDYI